MKAGVSRCFLGTILLIAPHAIALDLYVSPDGSDARSGQSPSPHLNTNDGPLATLEGAKQAIRTLRRSAEQASQAITVHIAAGDWFLPDTSFELTAEDSGTEAAPITYCAADRAKVFLVGGRRLPEDAFQPVTDRSTLDLLPAEARQHLRLVDLKPLGITDYGIYPDAFRHPPTIPELFFNDQRMTLARWPNGEWATIGKVIESGAAGWRNHGSDRLGTFEYTGDRPARWLQAPAVWLDGYWCFDWCDETIRIRTIDTATRQITLGSKHVYGLGSGNPAPRRYCAVNLLEELDSAGEYYIDRQRGRLYFWPPATLRGARVILSTARSPLIVMKGASFITWRGLTFENCAGHAIDVTEGRSVRIDDCRIRNTGQMGIVVNGGSHHSISGCEIHDTGGAAVSVKGGDRKTLAPSGHEIVNNHIYRPSRRQLTYAGHIHVGGVGVRVAHNLLHDSPHLAIILGGNDHLIEFNDIHHVATETDDCGAFYMGRNPSERGTVIRYNFWHDVGSTFAHGSCAVYFDDGAGGQNVFGNVFYRAAGGDFGAVFVHGGHDNNVTNNIFIDCKRALGAAPWDDKRWKDYVNAPLWQKVLLKDVDITRPPYIDRYPDLRGFMHPDGHPRMNHATRNIVVRCGDFMKGNWEQRDNFITDADPGFANAGALDFSLRKDSVAFARAPGFEQIPFGRIGLLPGGSARTSNSDTRPSSTNRAD